ncbi:MAG: alpha/beta fold hydrolase [Pseudomonadota bacterium]
MTVPASSGVVDFNPAAGLRNPHLQSIVASSGVRRAALARTLKPLHRATESVIIETPAGVRLAGLYTPHEQEQGLLVLFHGWEGSARSAYLAETALLAWRAGFSVFRLNFRDHGETHHLNEGIFHSCRIDEVVDAVGEIQRRYPVRPLLLGGYSLGGNFALRTALRAPAAGIDLHHVVAICPAICPSNGLKAIVSAPFFYNAYFMRRWRRSLRRKGELFPQHGIDEEMLNADMYELTDRLVRRYTDYASAPDYFEGYSIAGETLSPLAVPATLLTASDDPVIPVSDFDALKLPPSARLIKLNYGGHCGFISNWRLQSWAPRFLVQEMNRVTTP